MIQNIFIMCLVIGLQFSAALTNAFEVKNKDFVYSDLLKLIQDHHINSIEELLPLLPAEFRAGYVLMHESRSLQEASGHFPRVIMFGKNASLTCAFNGDKSQAGFDTLECFQFLKETRRFDFRMIQFPTVQNQLQVVVFSKSGQSTTKLNSCSSCHASDLRPNWDAYSNWPGAYGSNDDNLIEDKDSYLEFVKARSAHPRYKWLIQGEDPRDPYLAGRFNIGNRPNLRFSDLIGRMNAFRASRILESKLPFWARLGFVYSALKCELNSEQLQRIKSQGLAFETDVDLTHIFTQLNMKPNEWRTQILNDEESYPSFEHQAGFGFLSQDASMAILLKLSEQGDADFQNGFKNLDTYLHTKYSGEDLDFFSELYGILPDPDHFSESYQKNINFFCPKLNQIFSDEYLKAKTM